jgi:hypothetical protein
MMITRQRAIDTLDMGFDGCRHTADYAFKRLKKSDLTPSQLRWLARRCAIDLQSMDRVWRCLREDLIKTILKRPRSGRTFYTTESEAN